jgi:hypothetical protein
MVKARDAPKSKKYEAISGEEAEAATVPNRGCYHYKVIPFLTLRLQYSLCHHKVGDCLVLNLESVVVVVVVVVVVHNVTFPLDVGVVVMLKTPSYREIAVVRFHSMRLMWQHFERGAAFSNLTSVLNREEQKEREVLTELVELLSQR